MSASLGRAVALKSGAFVATLLGATAFLLLLLLLAPGDPVDLLPNGAELRPRLEAEWGLDRPLPARFLHYVRRVAALDLGTSLTYRPGRAVLDVITGPALRTLGRVVAALGVALLWGTGLAWLTAGRATPLRALVQAGSIVPVFLMAHAMVLALNTATFAAMQADLVTRPAWFALPDQPSLLRTVLSVLILATASGALHETHAQVEEALVRIRRAAYIDAARARGAPVWRHVAWNLVPPLAATLAERAAFLAGSVVIVEKVLLLNGAGAVLWEAALLRDYDVALGIALYAAAFVGLARLTADGVRFAVDPRLREPA